MVETVFKLAFGWSAGAGGLALLHLALAACSSDNALTLVRAVEPPPARYASGPTLSGVTRELSFSTPEAVQAFCNRFLGPPRRGYYEACYIPALDLVVLPDKHAWPSARERAELRAHEWAHARGWRHVVEDVKGTGASGAR